MFLPLFQGVEVVLSQPYRGENVRLVIGDIFHADPIFFGIWIYNTGADDRAEPLCIYLLQDCLQLLLPLIRKIGDSISIASAQPLNGGTVCLTPNDGCPV